MKDRIKKVLKQKLKYETSELNDLLKYEKDVAEFKKLKLKSVFDFEAFKTPSIVLELMVSRSYETADKVIPIQQRISEHKQSLIEQIDKIQADLEELS